MKHDGSSPIAQDALTSAIKLFSELVQNSPEKSRQEILREVELKFDLSPRECAFLDQHFADQP